MLPRRYAAIVPALLALAVFIASSQQPPAEAPDTNRPARTTPPPKAKSKVGKAIIKGSAKATTSVASAENATAQALLNSMSLRDRIAQLVIGVAYGDVYSTESEDYKKYHRWINDLHIGGLIVINEVEFGSARNANPFAMAVFLNQMQKLSKLPLLVGADFERAASMRVTGGTQFPHSMAFGATGDVAFSRYEGLITAREARALGVHWVLAPVADVNNNPRNPIINIRSYGEDPQVVSDHVAAFIEGAHSDPAASVLVTAKHFPGHGDVNVDSHLGLPQLSLPRDRMDTTELMPFRVAIAKGVDSIMTAHMAVPELEPSGVPATVSPKILTGLLRNELDFKGFIVTDALDMKGMTEMFATGEASVRSLIAGADVLLLPPDPEASIRAVERAVDNGRIPKQRINDSALRVLSAKVRLGLMKTRFVDINDIADTLAAPAAATKAQEIADRSVTLLRNNGNVLPLAPASRPCLILINSLRTSLQGQRFVREFRRRASNGQVFPIDTGMPLPALEGQLNGTSKSCTSFIAASFAAITSNTTEVNQFLDRLTQGSTPVIIATFNDPYMGGKFPRAAAYLTPFSSAPTSELAVAKALFGEIEISGHTPVTIPDVALLGQGIKVPRSNATLAMSRKRRAR
jgi:beta-N-acetylhexosaminidase